MTRRFTRLAACAPLAIAGIWAAAPSKAFIPTDCILTITEPIPVTADPVRVLAKFSEPVGDSLSGKFPEESKIEVVSVKHEQSDPLSAMVTLNTMRGLKGEWMVSIRGEQGMCTGKVWVGKSTPGDVKRK